MHRLLLISLDPFIWHISGTRAGTQISLKEASVGILGRLTIRSTTKFSIKTVCYIDYNSWNQRQRVQGSKGMRAPFSSLNVLNVRRAGRFLNPISELYVTMKGILGGQVDKFPRGDQVDKYTRGVRKYHSYSKWA